MNEIVNGRAVCGEVGLGFAWYGGRDGAPHIHRHPRGLAMQTLCPYLPSWEMDGGRSLIWNVPLPSGKSRECPGLSK